MTDSSIVELLQSCTNLEKLILKFCKGVVRSATFAQLACSERLRHLDIQGAYLQPMPLTIHESSICVLASRTNRACCG